MEKKRVEWLDIMKGVLILFVILSHSYPSQLYRFFFTPFFLTMFFWASGYTFSAKSNFKDFLYGKVKRLLIPFVCLGSIRVLIMCFLSKQNIWTGFTNFALQISCRGDEMWFVSCLLVSSLLFYCIMKAVKYRKLKKENPIILVCSAVLMLLGFIDIKLLKIRCIWELEIACVMTFYMALGFYYRKEGERLTKIVENKKVVLVSAFLYMVLVFGIQNPADIHAEQIPSVFLFVVTSLLAIIPLLWVSRILSYKKIKKQLIFLGQNTIFYYAFAGIVRIVLYGVLNRIGIVPDTYIVPIVCTILSAVILVIPAKFVRKYIPWAVGGR